MSEPDAETDMLRTFNKNGLNADKSSILTNEVKLLTLYHYEFKLYVFLGRLSG